VDATRIPKYQGREATKLYLEEHPKTITEIEKKVKDIVAKGGVPKIVHKDEDEENDEAE